MARLRILILSDGRPGHYRQSEAICAALARKRDISVTKFDLPKRAWLPRALVPKLAATLPSRIYLKLVHDLRIDDLPEGDLVVSAGAATFGASLALKRLRNTPNVIAGSLRSIDPNEISLTLLPYARARHLPNHAFLIKPAMIDPVSLPEPKPWPGIEHAQGHCIGVLIGGPTSAAKFAADDWDDLARVIGDFAKRGFVMRVATSPRTPSQAYAALEPLASKPDISIIDFRSAGPGSNTPVFACDALLVTSDSMSMITEAVAAQRPVIALKPRSTSPTPDDEAVATLVEENWLRSLSLGSATPEAIDQSMRAISPMRENHLDVLAQTVLTRLGL